MIVRRISYLIFSFLFLSTLTFCKTQKESTKNNGEIKNAQPIDKVAMSASSVPVSQMDISPEETKEMNELAEKMTVLYCDIKSLELSLKDSNDNESIQSLDSKKKSLIEYQALADSTYQVNSHKARFEQVYGLKKRRCE